jgi:hypothetical protein
VHPSTPSFFESRHSALFFGKKEFNAIYRYGTICNKISLPLISNPEVLLLK